LKIPTGTQNGRTFRLRGKGMPVLSKNNAGQYGDLLASVTVQLPETLTEKQRTLFEELRRIS